MVRLCPVLSCAAVFTVVTSVIGSSAGDVILPSGTDDSERRFLEALTDRTLFVAAEDYCDSRIRSRPDPVSQAFWMHQLSEVRRAHVWAEGPDNRQALTQQIIDEIADFLNRTDVPPEAELTLLLDQIDAVRTLAETAVRLSWTGCRGPDMRQPVFSERARSLVSAARKRLIAFRRDLDRVKRRLSGRQAGLLRERTRRIEAELDAVDVLAGQGDLQTAMRHLQELHRAARTEAVRWTALTRLLELQLLSGDAQAARLTLRRLQSQFPGRGSELTYFAALRRLSLGEAAAAAGLLEDTVEETSLCGSAGAVLYLESLLLLRMHADRLHDADRVRQTNARFFSAYELARQWKPSVWRDAAAELERQYRLVETVGADLPELIDEVDRLRQAGNPEEALRVLQRAMRLAPPDIPARSMAALQVTAGELRMQQRQWLPAVQMLADAARTCAGAGLEEEAARTDLLRIFCLGQDWKNDPADETKYQAYREALLRHRERWRHQASWATCQEWLIQLTEPVDPLQAVRFLMELAEYEKAAGDSCSRLVRLGTMLERLRSRADGAGAATSWQQLVDRYARLCGTPQATQAACSESAGIRVLVLMLTCSAETSWDGWVAVHDEIRMLHSSLPADDVSGRRRLNELEFLAAARTSTDGDALRRRSRLIVEQAASDPLVTAWRLHPFLSRSGLIQPGDAFVARTINELVRRHLETADSEMTAEHLLDLLRLTGATRRLTSDDRLHRELQNRILSASLTETQVRTVAELLMKSAAGNSDVPSGELREFWRSVRDGQTPGSALWLEAGLQLAGIRMQQGQAAAAARDLDVLSVLYPDWGSAERRWRAEQLRKQVESRLSSGSR